MYLPVITHRKVNCVDKNYRINLIKRTFLPLLYLRKDPIFDEDHQCCRWHVFKQFETQAMFDNMKDKVFPFIKEELHAGKDTAFAKYMKDALFLVPTPRVLERVIAALDDLDLNNKDIMGDVYEYLLSQMATSGTNGQFRTPRHIIKMMTELMQPTLEDTICDPAMGSAGFICAAAGSAQRSAVSRHTIRI